MARKVKPQSTRRNPKNSPGGRSRDLQLTARVLRTEQKPPLTQDEFCRLFSITNQTARNWRAKGLPVVGDPARPKYPVPDAITWAIAYTVLTDVPKITGYGLRRGRAIRHLSLEDAERWTLKASFEDDERRGESRHWAIVPLDWDHPARERQLRLAAEGLRPSPRKDEVEEDLDGELEEDDETGDADE